MTFSEIETARLRAGLSALELCRRAGLHHDVYYRAKSGRARTRKASLDRLVGALDGKSRPKRNPRAPLPLIRAAFRGWAAHFAQLLGADPEKALASDPSLRANSSPEWRRAARVRELAAYCTVTELDVPGARVAKAIGVTKAAVSIMLGRVEDGRSDPETDALIEAAGKLIAGRVE